MKNEWENRVKDIENNYTSEINRLREQLNVIRSNESAANAQMITTNRKLEE